MFDLAYKNLAIIAHSRSEPDNRIDTLPPGLPSRFIGVLDEMRRDLAQRDVPFVLSTFLVKYRRNQGRATQISNADVAFYYMPWMSIDGMLNAVDLYNEAILSFARTHHLPVVDDRDAIPATDEYFADCMHLADKGNEAQAERFSRFIQASEGLNRAIRSAADRR